MRRDAAILGVALGVGLALGIAISPAASAQATLNFGAGFWGDGQRWGTVVTPAALPSTAPLPSFDGFFIVTNSNNPAGQAPVVEAAPGNPAYNGGRWASHTVVWTDAGFAAHGTVPVLTSYADILFHEGLGHLTVTLGSPAGGPPAYFECPLVPFSG